ncbi:MerR family transcriptional regulator [bacterium SCSIO 12696]|nr:MerR family transcriptional regulator [bacterium SCSIO 12696]
MKQVTMSIGAAARMTGINPHTLRMWERRYQLGPERRSAGGQRAYTATDIDHLRLIKKLVDQGMRIKDIAQLPTKTLTSLLLESGEQPTVQSQQGEPVSALVVGTALGRYFKRHIKRYPRLSIEFSDYDAEVWLNSAQGCDQQLLVLQQQSLNNKHLDALLRVSEQKVHIILFYLYAREDIVEQLNAQGITLIKGNIDTDSVDEAVNKVIRLASNLSALDQSGQKFDISLPGSQPRQFDEAALVEAEALANKLNCDCPSHLVDLIRRLNAFEEYSQTCGAENWKQAAVHACVYSYTNQARYIVEKALRAVLDE